jgi:putative toxin-antitoxin system antitoxin component (TIGR02293 family)
MAMEIFEPLVTYGSIDDIHTLSLVEMVRQGIGYEAFHKFADRSPFSFREWSSYLHLSERSMQRYRNEKKTFDPLQSEKIIEIALLYNKGIEVFGNSDRFDAWLTTENLSLGNIRPKTLLDNSFGIHMVKDELIRIEYGVLA